MAVFEVTATNPGTLDRYALRFAFVPAPVRRRDKPKRPAVPPMVTTEVPARGLRTVHVPLPAPTRGRLPAPRITIETRFPFGLWRAWAYLTPALTGMVYPKPEENAPPLPPAAGGDGDTVGMASSGDDFAGVRPYQPGDAQKLIAWRLAARSDDLSVKQFEAAGGGELMLDFDALPPSMDLEARLSRLARWVLDADAAHMRYGVRLPGRHDFRRQRLAAPRSMPDGAGALQRLTWRRPHPTPKCRAVVFPRPWAACAGCSDPRCRVRLGNAATFWCCSSRSLSSPSRIWSTCPGGRPRCCC